MSNEPKPPIRPMTLEEMEQYIKTLEARISELERRMDLLPWSKTKNESEQWEQS